MSTGSFFDDDSDNDSKGPGPFLPPTGKGETCPYEGKCMWVKMSSTLVDGKVAEEYEYRFVIERTFPEGHDVCERYGMVPFDWPQTSLKFNSEEHPKRIIALNRGIRWNGKEGEGCVCAAQVMLLVSVMPAKKMDKGGKWFEPKATIINVGPMPLPEDLLKRRAESAAIRAKLNAGLTEDNARLAAADDVQTIIPGTSETAAATPPAPRRRG